jgi:beta-lactamase superfamily II metal-dependent hydrolase
MHDKLKVAVRMYRVGELGDCFLLMFTHGERRSRMLIDCGSFRNSATSKDRLVAIAKDIQQELGGESLDVVVGTHQHNDHLSGFVHAQSTFKAIGVEQVWLSWMDDQSDALARRIGAEYNNFAMLLAASHKKLSRSAAPPRAHAARAMRVLGDALGFLGVSAAGVPPELPAQAVQILKKLGRKAPLYLRPGNTTPMPGLPRNLVRVHVLGPPREKESLRRKDPRKGESYDVALAAASLSASKFLDAVNGSAQASAAEGSYPFTGRFKRTTKAKSSPELRRVRARYEAKADAWRRIDDDWLGQAEGLGLFLDNYTNNSSLALAIELVESGKVLLFPADAQTGNWASWFDVQWDQRGVTTDKILEHTVLYKVGHHGSHNATLLQAMEKMTHPDLVALLPVDKDDPNIKRDKGWKMPAKHLMTRLNEKTSHRTLRMDGADGKENALSTRGIKASWLRAGIKPVVKPLYLELQLEG